MSSRSTSMFPSFFFEIGAPFSGWSQLGAYDIQTHGDLTHLLSTIETIRVQTICFMPCLEGWYADCVLQLLQIGSDKTDDFSAPNPIFSG